MGALIINKIKTSVFLTIELSQACAHSHWPLKIKGKHSHHVY
jgi:hypothetical protein